MSRPLWFVRFVERLFGARSFFAKWTRVPLLGRLIDFLLFHRDRIFYLPRSEVIPINRTLPEPADQPLPTRVVEHFIRNAKFLWIMESCICRNAAGCRDYPIELGCLFLGEAVLDINPRLGRLVTRDEALAHIRRCQEAGLVHLIGRNKLDTVWLGIGPGSKLLTICNCCPCCCLWKMLPHLDASIGRRVTKLPGLTVRVTERCTGCGRCTANVCFVNAIAMNGCRAEIGDDCRGCGRCAAFCPENAIDLSFGDAGSIDDVIALLGSLVDVE